MLGAEKPVLNYIRFSQTSDWNIKQIVSQVLFNSKFDRVCIGDCLKRIKDEVSVQDDVCYKRLTIKTKGGGVSVRDELLGKDIKTKNQYRVSSGQLAVSKIDARNGAFGIVPLEADNAIITGNFWTFDVDTNRVFPQFLVMLLSSEQFVQAWLECSNGSGNRLYLQEKKFLKYKIPLPSVDEQQALLDAYNESIKKATEIENKRENLAVEFNNYIFEDLGISFSSITAKGILNTIGFKRISRWDPAHLKNRVFVCSQFPLIQISNVLSNFMVDQNGKSLRRDTSTDANNTYQYIGMENIEKNTGKRQIKEVLGADILSQTVWVPKGYIIYGKLRPYLNKYWQNNTEENNIICSSEFFVFDTQNINKDYFIAVLTSDIIQKQLPPLYSGARMPRINEDDFSGLQIPLPPENIQCEIAERSYAIKKNSEALRAEAESLRQRAKKEFEEAVFGGV